VNVERFDTAAARAELARIDSAWDRCLTTTANSFHELRALLGRALDAIDAGWPEPSGDVVERAAVAAFDADSQQLAALHGRDVGHYGDWNSTNEANRQSFRRCARAALRAAGRMPEPFAITDAVVEEAAIRAWLNMNRSAGRAGWITIQESTREIYRDEARAVLGYAATLQPVAPAHPRAVTPLPVLGPPYRAPAVDPREERLTRYRCAALPAAMAIYTEDTSAQVAAAAEAMAHAMLAAERKAAQSPDVAALHAGIAEALRLLTECGVDRDSDAADILRALLPPVEVAP
jgi:hypothetical protein